MAEILKLFLNSYTFKVVTLGCTLLGIVSAIIGTFAVLKKESLLGDGISHASLAGICLAFFNYQKERIVYFTFWSFNNRTFMYFSNSLHTIKIKSKI